MGITYCHLRQRCYTPGTKNLIKAVSARVRSTWLSRWFRNQRGALDNVPPFLVILVLLAIISLVLLICGLLRFKSELHGGRVFEKRSVVWQDGGVRFGGGCWWVSCIEEFLPIGERRKRGGGLNANEILLVIKGRCRAIRGSIMLKLAAVRKGDSCKFCGRPYLNMMTRTCPELRTWISRATKVDEPNCW